MLWIVSGPSSVGKSTFIEHKRSSEITGLAPHTKVVFPDDPAGIEADHSVNRYLHYNILRCVHLLHDDLIREQSAHLTELARPAYGDDPRWSFVRAWPGEKKALVLVTSRQALLQRIQRRTIIERSALTGTPEALYPGQVWEFIIGHVNLRQFYQEWLSELKAQRIPYLLVDSTDDRYRIIDHDEMDRLLSESAEPAYTKHKIEQLLREHAFEYQRIELPYGLSTPGADRSDTRDVVFPASFAGKSVLDVGSALGYFCFEAEARGAERVVGYEPMERRFEQAMLLKKIKQSRVEFIKADIIEHPPSAQFDYVFLLNVIHHLKEPMRAIRLLASIARERLVIEFPTLEDEKFRATTSLRFPFLLNRLPLMGVSSMPGADQTFVFTREAIKRIVLDHDALCRTVEFVRSPMKGRAIAVCSK